MNNPIILFGSIGLSIIIGIIVFFIIHFKKDKKKQSEEHYTNIDDVNQEEDDDLQKINLSVWKKIFKIVLKKKKHLIIMIISMFFVAGLDVITPLINSKIIENFFSENPDFSNKWVYILIYVGIIVGYAVSIKEFIYHAGNLEAFIAYEIRREAFEKLQILPFSYYDKTPSGWIMARMTSDARKLSDIVSWGLIDLFWGSFTMLFVLVIAFIIKWQLALIIAVVTPILAVVSIFFTRTILKAYRKVRKTNSMITGSFSESILGAKTTKTLSLEDDRNNEFNKLTHTMKRQSISAVMKSSLFWPIIFVLGYVCVCLIIGTGSAFNLEIIGGVTITVEVLYLFITYATLFYDPVQAIAQILADFQQAEASAERIISLIECPVDIKDTDEVIEKYGTILEPKFENFEEASGYVEFKDVDFSYIKEEPILQKFNLKVNKGDSIALVGKTGAGKSTIINLLCRFYEPTNGEILFDGKDYRQRSITWLHSNLGYVLQTPHLFNGTIKENIAYGKKDATEDEIMFAAKTAQAHEFIEKLPDKYDTVVGEGGSKLSVGECQLISLARAILINPRILILDEASSSIDTQTEANMQKVVDEFMKGRTTFIVAHRLSTIVNATRILVIDGGKIIESGTHKELLSSKGVYYNLYRNQFIDEQYEESKK